MFCFQVIFNKMLSDHPVSFFVNVYEKFSAIDDRARLRAKDAIVLKKGVF